MQSRAVAAELSGGHHTSVCSQQRSALPPHQCPFPGVRAFCTSTITLSKVFNLPLSLPSSVMAFIVPLYHGGRLIALGGAIINWNTESFPALALLSRQSLPAIPTKGLLRCSLVHNSMRTCSKTYYFLKYASSLSQAAVSLASSLQ